ncbi:c-type cytochrome [Arenimonas fontis]|uniref:Cytochrome c n=1 Tax=Arenimonas fontis TaxID=2608255 RepID=A0A5B2ZG27_9GAMM|nr:cytochrome c [Arenimonas fontis]KAA2286012.1 cytochrome c [Arenimonas fontis]
MSIRTVSALALLALTLPAFATVPAGNPVAGQEKSKTCASCHGPTGNESLDGTYPKLAGQHADYLVKALRDYRSGERNNPIMAGFAGGLSDQDIDDLAAFYASQPGDLHDLSKVGQR